MKEAVPVPGVDELPSSFADRIGLHYSCTVTQAHKKENGQFFTPVAIAHFMASLSVSKSSNIRILDPGYGAGILTCALIEDLVARNPQLKSIELIAYETDVYLIPFSDISIKHLKEWLLSKGIDLTYFLHVHDFVLDNAAVLNQDALFMTRIEPFDIIISNPPYFKLSRDDDRTIAASVVVSGQPNIYCFFMAIAANLLKIDGELIFITPRSFASGNYFKAFREFFFTKVQVKQIHLFVSRKDTFTRDNVLQETVIIKGVRTTSMDENKHVVVSSSHGLKDIQSPSVKNFVVKDLIDFKTKEKFFNLPVNDTDRSILKLFKSWKGSLNKYGLQISTGPVVSFRSWNFIQDKYQNGSVFLAPLFWLHNVNKMLLEWPLPRPNKGQYIRVQNESKAILIPNKNYILLRRFSSKDDKSRLIAAPYFCNSVEAEYIGVENKVNYIYRPKGHLDRNEVIGLCALLNSELFDSYFRIFNGNVNVSATELREMTLPPLEIIREIGNHIILLNNFSTDLTNKIVNEHFETSSILESI